MNERRNISMHSKGKLASGLKRGAVVSGVTATLAAASLGGVPNADATCLGILGISINLGDGGHCSSNLTTFSLGIGPDTFAIANEGFFNAAIAIGNNITATAGTGGLDFLNLAFNSGQAEDSATSTVIAGGGGFNLAANLGGNANASGGSVVDMDIFAGNGFGNAAVNLFANRNRVHAEDGFLNIATTVGNAFSNPNGSENDVTATGSLSLAFSVQPPFITPSCPAAPCGNVVTANGPLSLVGAIGLVSRMLVGDFGITLGTPFNADTIPPRTGSTTGVVASGTQANLVRLNSTGDNTNGVVAGGTQANLVELNSTGDNTNGVVTGGTQGNRVGLNSSGYNTNGVVAGGTQGNRVGLNSSDTNTNGTVGGTHSNRIRSSLNAAPNRAETTSPGMSERMSERKSVNDRSTKWGKKSSDSASGGASGRTGDAKTGADSADDCDK
jgi:hypothetical protein